MDVPILIFAHPRTREADPVNISQHNPHNVYYYGHTSLPRIYKRREIEMQISGEMTTT